MMKANFRESHITFLLYQNTIALFTTSQSYSFFTNQSCNFFFILTNALKNKNKIHCYVKLFAEEEIRA